MEFDNAQPDNGIDAGADQEEAVDSPVGEEMETEEESDLNPDGQDPEEEGAFEEEENAEPAGQQPEDPKKQSREDDQKYAAARKEAEQRLRETQDQKREIEEQFQAEKNRQDAFAAEYGFKNHADLEHAFRMKKLMDSGMSPEAAEVVAGLQEELYATKEADTNKAALDLMQAYPETRQMDNLPDEVVAAVRNGETPINAYRDFKIKKLEAENQALRQNQDTKKKAIGGVKGKGAVTGTKSSFAAGLFGK